jgi:hypothetical protein
MVGETSRSFDVEWSKHVKQRFKDRDAFPIVEVLWWDAKAFAIDWEEQADSKLMPTTTVGYLIKESDDSVTLVSLINAIHIGHGITIPKGCIHEVTQLDKRRTKAG